MPIKKEANYSHLKLTHPRKNNNNELKWFWTIICISRPPFSEFLFSIMNPFHLYIPSNDRILNSY